MNTKNLLTCLPALLLLLLVVPQPVQPQTPDNKLLPAVRPSNEELQELLSRAQAAIEQAQAETRRARQQGEMLQQQLEENTRELKQLRETLTSLTTLIAKLQSDGKPLPTAPAVETASSAVTPSAAVQPAQSRPDDPTTLAERLDHLQEQTDVNAAQIREHAQTKVESDSRYRIRLSGMVLVNAFYNSDDSTLTDVPLTARPSGAIAQRHNIGATLRQTRIGFLFEGPRLSQRLGEARLSAEAEFDFWGGTSGRIPGDVNGSFRIVTASARLDWERSSLIVGQRPPLISPRNPTSLAAVWFPAMTYSGNLWQWIPQINAEHRIRLKPTSTELVVQGGMLISPGDLVQGLVIEGRPGYQSRMVLRHSLDTDRVLEFGLGGYFHRRSFPFAQHVDAYAVTSDWQVPLGTRFELSGEAYFGRAISLSEGGGSRIDDLFIVSGPTGNRATSIRGVHSAGGWLQLAARARPNLDFNFAYGQNDPRNHDLREGWRSTEIIFKNQAASANLIWALRQNFLVSLEYRRLWTRYTAEHRTNNHVNLAFGYIF